MPVKNMHGTISCMRAMERVVCLRAKNFDALIGQLDLKVS